MGILDRLFGKKKKKEEENNKNYYLKNLKKGKEYELQIAKMLKENYNYEVNLNGLQYGKLDDGIDLIAKNSKEILLIQCKNWENSTIKVNILKEFLGNVSVYIEKNLKNEKRKIRKIFVTSNEKDYKSLKPFIDENKDIFEYRIIKYERKF